MATSLLSCSPTSVRRLIEELVVGHFDGYYAVWPAPYLDVFMLAVVAECGQPTLDQIRGLWILDEVKVEDVVVSYAHYSARAYRLAQLFYAGTINFSASECTRRYGPVYA